jgi:hypothetical protein
VAPTAYRTIMLVAPCWYEGMIGGTTTGSRGEENFSTNNLFPSVAFNSKAAWMWFPVHQ